MAKAGCRSSASHETFRRELLRQAMADRSRLKAKRDIIIIITYPHRPCHGKEGAPCQFAACPARCARCKYHARALLLRHLRWFYQSRRSYRHHRSLRQRTVGDYSTSCQDRHCCPVRCRHSAIADINGKPVHGSPASRKASIGHDHRWCSNKQSSSPQPGSPEAFMPQMIRWTRGVVYRQKSPLFGCTQHPLAGPYNLSFSHTHDQGHLCQRCL